MESEGPEHVSVHGRESVVVISEDEYRRLAGNRPGKLPVDLVASSPLKDFKFEHISMKGPVMDIKL